MRKGQGRRDEWGEVGNHLDNISPVYQLTSFCDRLIIFLRVDCTYRKNIDKLEQRRVAP